MSHFLRRHFAALLVVSCVASQLGISALTAVIITNHFNSVAAELRLSSVESCHRLQILRVEDNRSHYADYVVFKAVLQSFADLRNTPFARTVEQGILAKAWVPLTNCALAVNRRGIVYPSPAPIPFYQRLPPESALTFPTH